jgi:hypothetical protein
MSLAPSIRLLAVAALAAGAPAALRAQETDALPFQPGHWAIEVSNQQEDLTSLGFLRFSSPGSAWLFAPGIVLGTGEIRQQDPFGGPETEADLSTLGLQLRVGYRRYQALGRGVVSHLGLGVLGQMVSTELEDDAGTSTEESTNAYGAYGELGGSYFFTPRFGVGGTAVASLVHEHQESEAFGSIEGDAWTFALPAARFHVTIVF